MNVESIYISHAGEPYGKVFADTVQRFQEGFLRDKVCADLESAFARAVDVSVRLLPVIKAKASV